MAVNNIINNTCSGGFTASGGTISISTDSVAQTINLGTGAAAKAVTVGSTNSTSSLTIQAGSVGMSQSFGNTINTGTNSISLSTDSSDATINIATGGAVKTATFGSTNTTSTTTVRSGTGNLNITSTNGALTINSGTGALGISTDSSASTISLCTGAAVKTVTLGSTNSTSTTTVQAGTGGVQIGNTFLNMPATTSTAGQLRINNLVALQCFGTSVNNLNMGQAGQFSTQNTATVAIGKNSIGGGGLSTAAQRNTACGSLSGTGITKSQGNVIIGYGSATGITAGTHNNFVGVNSGSSSGNTTSVLLINNVGVSGDGTLCRIGAATGTGTQQLNKTFIHGIRGITTGANDAIAVLIDSAGQLGTVSSSIRYKENIENVGNFSSDILKLRPVVFDFIDKPSHKKQAGLIAEEVDKVMKILVVYNEIEQPESIKYHELSVLLLNELKKLLKRIEFLEEKVV